jgi:hypothetical protein
MVFCWQGKVLLGLRDEVGAEQVYQRTLSLQFLYLERREVEGVLKRLKDRG